MGCSSSSTTVKSRNMAVDGKIKELVSANKVMVFSKSYCPYCTKAKKALDKFTQDYTVLELDREDDCQEYQDALKDMTGGRSVPRVFINGKFLGGGDETAAAAADGSLQKLLSE